MKSINFIALSLIFFISNGLQSQDSIRIDDIQRFSYSFDIEDDVFVGDGAAILTKAIANSNILMLGNNSRNHQESVLDIALSKILNRNNYNHLIMEVGPASAQLINKVSDDPDQIVETFKNINKKYFFETGGMKFMPIPDFKYLGTAKLLKYVKENEWSFAGIGVDSWVGFKLQLDHLYNNLSIANQKVYKKDYEESCKLIDRLYAQIKGQSYEDVLGLTEGLKSSEAFGKFLQDMSTFNNNTQLVNYLQFSIDYWWMYGSKQGFEKNRLSNKRNKSLMKLALEHSNFDFEEDKLFLKMWRGHLVNGVTRNGFYGIGNMLMELAAYHGHSSLNIGVLDRFIMEDGVVKDALESNGYVAKNNKPFMAMGQKDKWVLVDLRSFNQEFYWGNYVRTVEMNDMMRRFDMIIIPKTDSKAAINH